MLGGQWGGEYWGKKKPEPWLQQRMFMGSDLTRCGLQDAVTCWAQRSHKLQGDPLCWRRHGPAQCRNCCSGEGMRMSCPFSSRRSQSIR